MKKLTLLLCAVALLAVPACKRKGESCESCHHEKQERPCKKNRCSFFGRCAEGEARAERHHEHEDDDMEMNHYRK